jgi:hypothetical protein
VVVSGRVDEIRAGCRAYGARDYFWLFTQPFRAGLDCGAPSALVLGAVRVCGGASRWAFGWRRLRVKSGGRATALQKFWAERRLVMGHFGTILIFGEN